MAKKRYSRQQIKKLREKKCFFCPCDDYALLDVHRIFEGSQGGTYHDLNTVVCCSNCHRRIHDKQIVCHRWCMSTGKSLYVLHYTEDGVEKFKGRD